MRSAAQRAADLRYRQSAKGKATYAAGKKRYRQTPKGKAVLAAAQAKYERRNRPKRRAKDAVSDAVRSGKLTRLARCELCGASKPEAHHHKGYAVRYRLTVRWLCRACHRAAHGKKVGH